MARILALSSALALILVGCSALTDDDGDAVDPNALRCTTPTDPAPALGETFNVRAGEHATIAGEGLTLTFEDLVEDSRCAHPMICIVAGVARIVVAAEHPPALDELFELNTHSVPGSEHVYSGFEVQLVQVLPYPEVDRPIAPSDYCAELRVVRAE